jgi:hypothetical protein
MEKQGMFAITKKYGISVIAWALFSSSGLALATEPRVFINNQVKSSGNNAAYWTAERLKNAQVPLPPKPLAGFNLQQGFEQAAALAQKTESQHAEVAYENGHPPS